MSLKSTYSKAQVLSMQITQLKRCQNGDASTRVIHYLELIKPKIIPAVKIEPKKGSYYPISRPTVFCEVHRYG